MKLLVPPLNFSHENGFTPEVDIYFIVANFSESLLFTKRHNP